MSENIHEVIKNQIGWLEEDYLRFQSEQKKATAQAEALKTIARYLKTPKGTHKENIKFICKGNLQICNELGFFTNTETDFFLNLLNR